MQIFMLTLALSALLLTAVQPANAHTPLLPICEVSADYRVFTDAYLNHLALLYSDVAKRDAVVAEKDVKFMVQLERNRTEVLGSMDRMCNADWEQFAATLQWQNPKLAEDLSQHKQSNNHDSVAPEAGDGNHHNHGGAHEATTSNGKVPTAAIMIP